MPFFAYRGKDAQGRDVSGTVSAVDARAAAGRLEALGVTGVAIAEPAAPAAPVRPRLPTQTPARPGRAPSSPLRPPETRRAGPTAATRRVGIAAARDRFFFFERLSRYLASGFSLPDAFGQLADGVPARFREHIRRAGTLLASGTEMGDALGGGFVTEAEADALRAASRGGYLPEAAGRLGDLAHAAHRMNRFGAYPLAILAIGLFMIPVTPALQDASFRTMARQDAAGGTLPSSTILQESRASLPLAALVGLGMIALLYALWRVWMSERFRRSRHRMGAWVPLFASRARSESLAQIAFHLARLSAAGVPPAEAARLAASTPPNLFHRADSLARFGDVPTGTKLSAAFGASPLVSTPYRHLVETGELTGDVPGALDRVARLESDAEAAKGSVARKAGGSALLLLAAIFSAVYLGSMAVRWYGGLIKMFTADPSEPMRPP